MAALIISKCNLIAFFLFIVVIFIFIFLGAGGRRELSFSVLLHFLLLSRSVIFRLFLVRCLLFLCHYLPCGTQLLGNLSNCSLRILLLQLWSLLTTKEKETRPAYKKNKQKVCECICHRQLTNLFNTPENKIQKNFNTQVEGFAQVPSLFWQKIKLRKKRINCKHTPLLRQPAPYHPHKYTSNKTIWPLTQLSLACWGPSSFSYGRSPQALCSRPSPSCSDHGPFQRSV